MLSKVYFQFIFPISLGFAQEVDKVQEKLEDGKDSEHNSDSLDGPDTSASFTTFLISFCHHRALIMIQWRSFLNRMGTWVWMKMVRIFIRRSVRPNKYEQLCE